MDPLPHSSGPHKLKKPAQTRTKKLNMGSLKSNPLMLK